MNNIINFNSQESINNCPNCGSQLKIVVIKSEGKFKVRCNVCGIESPKGATKNETINDWNRLGILSVPKKCPKCNAFVHLVDDGIYIYMECGEPSCRLRGCSYLTEEDAINDWNRLQYFRDIKHF